MTPPPQPDARLSPAQRQTLTQDGYLHLVGALAPAWLDEVDALVASRQQQGTFEAPPPAGSGLFVIQSLSERAHELRPLLRAGPTVELAREVLGPSIRLLSDRYIVKPPHCQDVFPWHRDREEYANVRDDEGITLWIPLAAVTRENGCLWYVAGSHRTTDEAAPPPAPARLPMLRGDVALHSLGTLHMSGGNRSAEARAVVVLEYIKADALDPATGRPFERATLLEP